VIVVMLTFASRMSWRRIEELVMRILPPFAAAVVT
jgi:hypothetical protein